MGQDPYVVVHGGVHKTATSYVQAILQRNAGRMRKSGVHYVHHRDTRKEYTFPTQLNGYEKLGLNYRTKVPDEKLAKMSAKFFDKIGAGPGERIVISDENMPGHSGHCVRSGDLYNRRDTLIPIFAQNIPYPVTEVHLAIREYGDFFASTFVEFLRSAKGENVFPEAQMKRAVLSTLPSWTGFIDLVISCFPDAQLTVWRHEDFRHLSGEIIGNLVGPDIDTGALVEPKRKRGRPSASHKAVQEILMQIDRFGADKALEHRVEIQERYPRGNQYPGYDPWSVAERAHLGRLYERDCREIRMRKKVTFLAP
ncbi:hypothetical protein KUD11_03850 [Roseovarius sp. LXJ103]|uniref:hypothetical protein n=1 Tax=Roseovarius carneus TaxID=2853164 RepID=UPI000D619BFF|nr:hypothetical protein [Roseovarius carneus]MBZ8117772.1 hypothetical protein [Roseovarius carneus]PWE36457.1 hypothetical protein DD563_11105 [Pelagicola sp. LXJ1103]